MGKNKLVFLIFKMNKINKITHELKHHLPFTALATLIAVIITSIFFYTKTLSSESQIFNLLHASHILISAIVPAAIFYKYKKNYLQSILVATISSIIIGTLSDVLFPYVGASLIFLNPEFHIPLFEEPFLIIFVALIGAVIGILIKVTKIPHLIHVSLSIFASLFYLLAYASTLNLVNLILIFIIVVIAVIIPCCTSDIIFPFLFLKEKINKCGCRI